MNTGPDHTIVAADIHNPKLYSYTSHPTRGENLPVDTTALRGQDKETLKAKEVTESVTDFNRSV